MRLVAILLAAAISGCGEPVERETFTIQTVDGQRIELTCPVVASRRSVFTYIIDGHCVVEPPKKR